MTNINNYLAEKGNILISEESPFNEVDSMIMARFSYLIFNKIIMEEKETIKSISDKMSNFIDDDFNFLGDRELIEKLGKSLRFNELQVTDYIENNEKENEKQFSAITIHIDKNEVYVSYMGTNASIFGWKEDFNMAFMDNVPCQIEGKQYLKRVANKYKNSKIRIGGHSKGGNVAIYSAITASTEIQDRIIKVYNYDGPGFNENIIEKYGKQSILDKIETYFPQDSIIGRILNHKEKCSIVLSNEKGIMQHDIFSWQTDNDKLVYTKKLTDASEIMNKAVINWLNSTTNEQRKMFFDTIFELLYSTNANTFEEISTNLPKNLTVISKKYNQISREDKKMIMKVVHIFIKSYFEQLIKNEKNNAHLPGSKLLKSN